MRYDSLKLAGGQISQVCLPTSELVASAGALYATKDSIFVASGTGWDEVPISYPLDPLRAQVKSLLHFDGDTKNAVTGVPNSTIVQGAVSTAESKFGDGSCELLTVNSYCTVPQVGWNLNIFTIDFWIYAAEGTQLCRIFSTAHPNYAGAGRVLDVRLSNSYIVVNALDSSGGGRGTAQNTKVRVLADEWTHVAFVADGQVGEVFVNGVSGGKSNYRDAVGLTVPDSPRLGFNGAVFGTSGHFFIDEFCYTNAKRYTEDFTPPAYPYRLS